MPNTTAKPLPIVEQVADDPLSAYAQTMLAYRGTDRIDDTLREMEEEAARDNVPIIGPLEGALLHLFMSMRHPGATRILDIGTAIGYSAIWMARTLAPGAKVVSIELDPARVERAQYYIDKAGLSDCIELVNSDIFDYLDHTTDQYDIVFQDVIKHVYFGSDPTLAMRLLDACRSVLAPNGLLLSDNAFCMGDVLDKQYVEEYAQVAGIVEYNEQLAADTYFESVIVPVRDGLWVSQRVDA